MPKNPQNPKNPKTKPNLLAALAVVAVFAYAFAFFNLPSTLGFTGEDQSPLPRWFDLSLLLLWEEMLSGLTGHGRFEVGVLDRIPIVLAGTMWLAVSGFIGHGLMGFTMRPGLLTRLEYTALATLAGLAILSTTTLLIGLCGGLHSRWPLLLSTFALVAVSAGMHRHVRRNADANSDKSTAVIVPQENIPTRLLAIWASRLIPVATCVMAGVVILGSLVTPFEFDVVEYHLQAPKEFYTNGAITFIPHNIYANMPLGAEMHSLAAMTLIGGDSGWWWGGLVGKFVIGSVSILAAMLVGGFTARHFGNSPGWCASGLLLSAPGISFVSMAGLIDAVVGAYILAMAVMLTLAWRHSNPKNAFFLCGLFAGAAAACKYPGFIFAVLPLVFAAVAMNWKSESGMRAHASAAIAVVGGVCLTGIPWLIKNWFLAGNPFFPLAANIFGGRGLDAQRIAQWNSAHEVPTSGGSAYGLTSLAGSVKQLWLESSFLSPTLIPLVACGITYWIARRYQTSEKGRGEEQAADRPTNWLWGWLILSMWILAVWWLATHRIDRFWLPVVPLYAAIAAAGIAWLRSSLSVTLASSLVLLSIAYGGLVAVSGSLGDNRLFVSLSELRQDAGDEDYPGRLSPATLWINQNLSKSNSRILLIGEARVFDFEPPIEYATCFNENPAEPLLEGHSAEQQKSNLRAAGITHLMVHWAELRRYRSPGNYGFSRWPQKADIEQLIQSGVAERVAWPFDSDLVELLRVLP